VPRSIDGVKSLLRCLVASSWWRAQLCLSFSVALGENLTEKYHDFVVYCLLLPKQWTYSMAAAYPSVLVLQVG
jgi:hypothetical protein